MSEIDPRNFPTRPGPGESLATPMSPLMRLFSNPQVLQLLAQLGGTAAGGGYGGMAAGQTFKDLQDRKREEEYRTFHRWLLQSQETRAIGREKR